MSGRLLPLLFVIASFIISSVAWAQTPAPEAKVDQGLIYAAVAGLIVVLALFVVYMFVLQKRFFNGCVKEHQLSLFSQSPGGLPQGTVRSILALTIVFLSIFFITLQVIGQLEKFPEALSALLGAVIGFYFGSRGQKGGDEVLQGQITALKKQRDDSTKSEVGQLLKKVKKGVSLSKKALKFLPKDQAEKIGKTIEKLESGVSTAEKFADIGQVNDALQDAKKALQQFKQENPVKKLVEKAGGSFQGALGLAVPQYALIAAVVAVTAGLAGVKYQRWRQRVLHATFAAPDLGIRSIDAGMAYAALLATERCRQAFQQELDNNDRPALCQLAERAMSDSLDQLWPTYQDRFESREDFDEAMEELRRVILDVNIEMDVQPQWLGEYGNYGKLVSQIDKLYESEEASADLHALVDMVESLQADDEPVKTIIAKAIEEAEKE